MTKDIFWKVENVPAIIPSASIEMEPVEAICSWLPVLRELGFHGPMHLDLSLLNLRRSILGRRSGSFHTGHPVGPDYDVVPDTVIGEPDDGTHPKLPLGVAAVLQGPIDFMWREFGFGRSPNFDEQSGVWAPRT